MPKTKTRYSEKERVPERLLGRITREMDRRKISQSELAELSGCHRVTINNVLNGRSAPTVAWLERILEAMGLELYIKKSANE